MIKHLIGIKNGCIRTLNLLVRGTPVKKYMLFTLVIRRYCTCINQNEFLVHFMLCEFPTCCRYISPFCSILQGFSDLFNPFYFNIFCFYFLFIYLEGRILSQTVISFKLTFIFRAATFDLIVVISFLLSISQLCLLFPFL